MAKKPIISQITPWDATLGTTIKYDYSGNDPVSYRAYILNASTFRPATFEQYPLTETSSAKSIYIPPYVVKANEKDADGNGNKYCIQIDVTDSNGLVSAASDRVFFWCFAEPDVYYTKPQRDSSVEAASVELEFNYEQKDGEKLHNYRHYLYDNGKNQVAVTDPFYDDSGYRYTFRGLENKTSYFIRTVGVTKNGMPIDTGYLRFFTNYYEAEKYKILNLASDLNATVTGLTNMICIEANEDSDDYVFFNSYVQLIGKVITYEHNYVIHRDFTMQLKFTKLHYDTVIATLMHKENPNCYITIDQYEFEDGVRYCLKVFNGIATYVLYTDPIVCENDDVMVVNIRRVNNYYSIEALLVGAEE